eukprot:5219534-Amphidinium_carterae.1
MLRDKLLEKFGPGNGVGPMCEMLVASLLQPSLPSTAAAPSDRSEVALAGAIEPALPAAGAFHDAVVPMPTLIAGVLRETGMNWGKTDLAAFEQYCATILTPKRGHDGHQGAQQTMLRQVSAEQLSRVFASVELPADHRQLQ